MSSQRQGQRRKRKRNILLESDADAAEFVTFEEITVTKKNGKRETKRVKLALYPDLPARGRAFGDSDTNYIPIDGSNSGRSPTSALLQRTNMPIIEIASFAVSEAFLADPSIVTPALDFLIGVDGCLGVYHGIPDEDTKRIFLFIVWETFEHHKALIDHPKYPSIIGFRPSLGEGGVTIKHVEFLQDPLPALNAPITEILAMTLKEGKTKEELYDVLTILASKMDVDGPYPPVSRGEVREEPGKGYALVVGWNNSKEHFDLVGQASYQPSIQKLFDTVDFKMFHAALKKHSA